MLSMQDLLEHREQLKNNAIATDGALQLIAQLIKEIEGKQAENLAEERLTAAEELEE